jgi:hypothetical protein
MLFRPLRATLRDMLRLPVLAALVAAGTLACNKKPEPKSHAAAQLPATPTATGAPAAPTASSAPHEASVVWNEPSGWKPVPPSNRMRKADYVIPKVGDDKTNAELVVYYFGQGLGGGVEANMHRWTDEFVGLAPGQAQHSERTAHGMKQSILEIDRGTFRSGMPGQPTEADQGYALLAAIVATPGGNFYFKLTGPARTVSSAKKAFFELLDSVHLSS